MYIYLIKYNGYVIASAQDDERADQVIQQYMQNNKDMKEEMFEREAIRYFGDEEIVEVQSKPWNLE